MVKFYAVRHGNKNSDNLTIKGEAQIKASVEKLTNDGITFDRLFHSKTNRTKQCATIAAPIIGKSTEALEEVEGLTVDKPFASALNNDIDKYQRELDAIMSAGNNMANAMNLGVYPNDGRKHLAEFLVCLATEMEQRGESTAIGFSHSPFCTLAVPTHQAHEMPYEIGEADIVIYTIKNGVITNTEHVQCPYSE